MQTSNHTLNTFRKDIFDKVLTHLCKQKVGSFMKIKNEAFDDIKCMYRGPEGRMCAVGCLIPDDYYRENMEEINSDHLLVMYPDCIPEMSVARKLLDYDEFRELQDFLSYLQHLHDEYLCKDSFEMWLSKMQDCQTGVILVSM